MIIPTKKILLKARKESYAIGAFNTSNLEITKAIINAAEKLNAPVIIQTTPKAISYAGLDELHRIIHSLASKARVPVAIHLDHGKSLDLIKEAIKRKYNSVMIDASDKDFDVNVKITKKVVDLAHKHRIAVESELGALKGKEDLIKARKSIFTDPEEARLFVEKTNTDFLAVSIGTAHGAYKGKVKLDIKRLREIKELVDIPLVLHGASGVNERIVNIINKYGGNINNASGVKDRELKKAIKNGICKVNTDTDLRLAFTAALRKFLHENKDVYDPRKILGEAIKLIERVVKERIKLFGSAYKA